MSRVVIIVLLNEGPKLLQSIGLFLIVDFVEGCLILLETIQADVLILKNFISESDRLAFLVLFKVSLPRLTFESRNLCL